MILNSETEQWTYLPGHPQFGDLSSRHSLCALRYLWAFFTIVKLSQLHPPAQRSNTDVFFFSLNVTTITDHQVHQGCTHCLPPVAGSSTYLSKYNRTSRSRSSGPGRAKFTISSIRSLMAQSNCSGWLLAKTSMNLQARNQSCVDKAESREQQFKHVISVYLLLCSPVRYKKAFRVALRSSLIFSWKTESAPTVRF